MSEKYKIELSIKAKVEKFLYGGSDWINKLV